MVKKLVTAFTYLIALSMYAQNGTASPYSYFGIGDLRAVGTVENQMMGGIAVYADSTHINLRNPAAYARLGVQAGDDFGITVYTAGASRKEYRLKSFTDKERTSVTNLDYLSLGFSLGKGFGMGFGIMPYSSVGYNLVDQGTRGQQDLTNVYNGDGGLNRVYYSVGYEVFKNVSIGATVNFNFGNLESQRFQQIEDVQFATFDRRSSRINGFDFNYSLNYAPKFNNDHMLMASVRVNTQGNLVSKNQRTIGSILVDTGNTIEEIAVDLDAQNLRNTEFKIPTNTTVGLGYGKERKWFVGAEYGFQALGDFENPFLGVENVVYKDAYTYALGGFITPNSSSFTNYFNRITYRAGLRWEKSGMVVNDVDINNFGITFGLGLPMGRNFSNINLGFELGRRGTTRADLIEESYLKINIGLSLNDLWFQKRKIN